MKHFLVLSTLILLLAACGGADEPVDTTAAEALPTSAAAAEEPAEPAPADTPEAAEEPAVGGEAEMVTEEEIETAVEELTTRAYEYLAQAEREAMQEGDLRVAQATPPPEAPLVTSLELAGVTVEMPPKTYGELVEMDGFATGFFLVNEGAPTQIMPFIANQLTANGFAIDDGISLPDEDRPYAIASLSSDSHNVTFNFAYPTGLLQIVVTEG